MINNSPDKPDSPKDTAGDRNRDTDDFPVLKTRRQQESPQASKAREKSSRLGQASVEPKKVKPSQLEFAPREGESRKRVLLVEPSSTMRYVLEKYLTQLDYNVESLDDFKQAQSELRVQFDEFDSSNEVVAVLFGWQSAGDPVVERFLNLLESPDFHDMPVIALSQEMRAQSRAWVAGRLHTELVRWKDYRQVSSRLEYMLDMDLQEPATITGSDFNPRDLAVLVVDDSSSIRLALRDLLTSQGYRTTLASTHEQAMQLATENRFDIAVLDYYLEESTGDALCADLIAHSETGDVTCAILTGSYSDHIIKRCLSSGAIECMFKNESSELLLSRINAIGRMTNQRKQGYEKLQQMRRVLSVIGADCLVIDDQQRIVHVGRQALTLMAKSKSDVPELLIDQPLSQLFDASVCEKIMASDHSGGNLDAFVKDANGQQQIAVQLQPITIAAPENTIPVVSTGRVSIKSIWKVSNHPDYNATGNRASTDLASQSQDPSDISTESLSVNGLNESVDTGVQATLPLSAPLPAVAHATGSTGEKLLAVGPADDKPEREIHQLSVDDTYRAMVFTKNLDARLEAFSDNDLTGNARSAPDDAMQSEESSEWRQSVLLLEMAYEDMDRRLKPVTADPALLDQFLLALRQHVTLETDVAYFGSSRIGFAINHDSPAAGLMQARVLMQNCSRLAIAAGFSAASCVGALVRLDLHRNRQAEEILADLHRVLPNVASSGRNRLLLTDYERFLPVYPDKAQ